MFHIHPYLTIISGLPAQSRTSLYARGHSGVPDRRKRMKSVT